CVDHGSHCAIHGRSSTSRAGGRRFGPGNTKGTRVRYRDLGGPHRNARVCQSRKGGSRLSGRGEVRKRSAGPYPEVLVWSRTTRLKRGQTDEPKTAAAPHYIDTQCR